MFLTSECSNHQANLGSELLNHIKKSHCLKRQKNVCFHHPQLFLGQLETKKARTLLFSVKSKLYRCIIATEQRNSFRAVLFRFAIRTFSLQVDRLDGETREFKVFMTKYIYQTNKQNIFRMQISLSGLYGKFPFISTTVCGHKGYRGWQGSFAFKLPAGSSRGGELLGDGSTCQQKSECSLLTSYVLSFSKATTGETQKEVS